MRGTATWYSKVRRLSWATSGSVPLSDGFSVTCLNESEVEINQQNGWYDRVKLLFTFNKEGIITVYSGKRIFIVFMHIGCVVTVMEHETKNETINQSQRKIRALGQITKLTNIHACAPFLINQSKYTSRSRL